MHKENVLLSTLGTQLLLSPTEGGIITFSYRVHPNHNADKYVRDPGAPAAIYFTTTALRERQKIRITQPSLPSPTPPPHRPVRVNSQLKVSDEKQIIRTSMMGVIRTRRNQ